MKCKFTFKTELWVPVYTGIKVDSLKDFINAISIIPDGSLLYHFYINLLNYHNIPTLYMNSFAYWLYINGYESLAEKISIIDPTEHYSLDALRFLLMEALKEHADDKVKRQVQPFYFLDVRREVLFTGLEATDLQALVEGVRNSSIYSIFYHMVMSKIDRKSPVDEYSEWLINSGYAKKAEKVAEIDLYAMNLYDVKLKLLEVLSL